MKDPIVYLLHILDCIHHIEEYTANVEKEEFMINFLIRDAVVRNLEVIGEASRNIPSPFREKYPAIPWRDIIAMRNKVIHEYFSVDSETVWNVIKSDIHILKEGIEEIVKSKHH